MHKKELERKIDQFNTIFANGPVQLALKSFQSYTNYFFANIQVGSNAPDLHESWFVELWANNKCLFRESLTNRDEENLNQYEDQLCARILLNVFTAGIKHYCVE